MLKKRAHANNIFRENQIDHDIKVSLKTVNVHDKEEKKKKALD
jgi:hypothetical protein